MKYGYLRESEIAAIKAGIDSQTGIHRTGLDTYLKVIFPNTTDWIYNKKILNGTRNFRPDYQSKSLKLIVEFDGLPHFQNPEIILNDLEKDFYYMTLGYNVVRIPFFIQLTNKVVKQLFGVEVKEELFNDNIPSMIPGSRSTPAYFCPLGIHRMNDFFEKCPEQKNINYQSLANSNLDSRLIGLEYIK